MRSQRLQWRGGRVDEAVGQRRTLEWIGVDDAGEAIARVVRILGPVTEGWRSYRAVALDDESRLIELRPLPPVGVDWLAYVGGQVVGRAALPLQAVRRVEAALGAP